MAFGVSRSSKRHRGQYEASNVSQGDNCMLKSLRIDTAQNTYNIPYASDGGDGTAGNLFSAPAEIAFRNKCSSVQSSDDITGKILVRRYIGSYNNWARSEMLFQTSIDGSVSGGNVSLVNRMCLDTFGQLYVQESVTASSTTLTTSDDRLKHNEKDVTGALDTIMKLKGKEYIKTKKLYDENHNFTLDADGNPIEIDEEGNEKKLPKYQYTWEKGFIAQEVEADIPELAKSVSKTTNLDGEEVNKMNYSNVFATNVCATQELCELVKKLTLRIQELEATIAPPELTRQ